jgi:hypothetical protein
MGFVGVLTIPPIRTKLKFKSVVPIPIASIVFILILPLIMPIIATKLLKEVFHMLDPQVQIRIIELAWELAKKPIVKARRPDDWIVEKAQLFDQAYKALLGTISEK